jgi:hypothetical protein
MFTPIIAKWICRFKDQKNMRGVFSSRRLIEKKETGKDICKEECSNA